MTTKVSVKQWAMAVEAVDRIFSDESFAKYSRETPVTPLSSAEVELASSFIGKISERYSKWLREKK